ncbi:MAG TPA: ferritin [Acidimicrobiia bacterium]|nr:ferritin [Acidimicrobiia bacterium]
MSDDLASAFNSQITRELTASVAYLQMAAYFEGENLTGMGSWMKIQSEEEKNHAHLFLKFVLDRGNQVRIGAIDAPATDFQSVEHVFEIALAREEATTKAIHDIYRLASESGDLASYPFLQSFIGEQNEEEALVETILERVRLAGGESSAIILLDNELGARKSP